MLGRYGLVAVLAMAMAACEGAQGPAGPAGPPGAAGTGKLLYIVPGAGGGATAALPPLAGDVNSPPALSCYMQSTTGDGTVWLAVADGLSLTVSTTSCGLVYSSGGHWTAVMINMPSGYRAAFVVVY